MPADSCSQCKQPSQPEQQPACIQLTSKAKDVDRQAQTLVQAQPGTLCGYSGKALGIVGQQSRPEDDSVSALSKPRLHGRTGKGTLFSNKMASVVAIYASAAQHAEPLLACWVLLQQLPGALPLHFGTSACSMQSWAMLWTYLWQSCWRYAVQHMRGAVERLVCSLAAGAWCELCNMAEVTPAGTASHLSCAPAAGSYACSSSCVSLPHGSLWVPDTRQQLRSQPWVIWSDQ